MRIGIITWYDVLNYGSVFQAYALEKTINALGCDAEILKHDRILPDYYHNKLKSFEPVDVYTWLRNMSPNRVRYRHETRKKFRGFEKFRNEHMNIGPHYSQTDVDRIVIGSDQIFDINGLYYPFQFGGDIPVDSISTYAPCFGETKLEDLMVSEHCDEITSMISKMEIVNARDDNTKNILENIRKEDIPMVLDPTLLYTFDEEKQKWNQRLIQEKYCLIYTWGGITTSEEFANKCQSFASDNNLKLVSVGEIRPWCDIQYAYASPIEFFELFMHADMVLTNMFHGTCFSIIMNKPFYSFVMPHNRNKVESLLNTFELNKQIVFDSVDSFMTIPVIDYDIVNYKIKKKRDKSMRSLIAGINI